MILGVLLAIFGICILAYEKDSNAFRGAGLLLVSSLYIYGHSPFIAKVISKEQLILIYLVFLLLILLICHFFERREKYVYK